MGLLLPSGTQRLEAATVAVAAKPLTLACWFRPSNITGTQYLLALLTAGTANRGFTLGHITGTPFAFERGDALGQGNAGSALTASTWGHVAGTFQSGTTGARTSYINGVAGTANTSTVGTPPTPDRTEVGAYNPSVAGTFANFATGVFAEIGIWDVALTQDEITALAKGFSPFLIRPSELVFYAPLRNAASPSQEIRGSRSLTWTGTPTLFAHGQIFGQSGRLWTPPGPPPSPVAAAGTIAASSTLTGALTVQAADTGTITSTSTLTGTLTVACPVAGTITITSTVVGGLLGAKPLVGTLSASSTLTGNVTAGAALGGACTGASTLTGSLHLDFPFAGTITSTSGLTASLSNIAHPEPRYAIHWFWEPGRFSEQPDPPDTCPQCGSNVIVMSLDGEVITRHYTEGMTKTDGTLATDCPYIATINTSNYAQPLPADIAAGYVLQAPA